MMHTSDLLVEDTPNTSDLEYLEDQINRYNVAVTGIVDWYPLAIFVRDERRHVVAGINGGMWGGYLEIRNLWVHEDLRGQGYGKRLLMAAEQQAYARGCTQVLLDTHDFQAPGFYKKLGYTVFGTFEGIGGRYNRYYLSKKLTDGE
jgi:GNAT superfamily N-acetyltransferase